MKNKNIVQKISSEPTKKIVNQNVIININKNNLPENPSNKKQNVINKHNNHIMKEQVEKKLIKPPETKKDNKEIMNILNKNKNQDIKEKVKQQSVKIKENKEEVKSKDENKIAGPNPLQEFLKKQRSEMKKAQMTPEGVIWLGKEKDPAKEEKDQAKEEKEYKFPKVILVEKSNKNTPKESEIDLEVPCPINHEVKIKKQKEQEEFYNLNRYLNELAKIDDEESTENTNDIADENKNSEEGNDTRDYQIIDEETTSGSNGFKEVYVNTDNSLIEEMKLNLENSIGIDNFKLVYKIVDQYVIQYLI
jgi:hypothetical protein